MTCGIYKITNQINNKVYIGSSINLEKRWVNHKCLLKNLKHSNAKLQRAVNKYGLNNFIFEIILVCESDELLKFEQYYIDLFTSYKLGYNILSKAKNSLGYHHTKETLEKMSALKKGRQLSKKHCEALSEAKKGKKFSEEHKKNLSKALTGRVIKSETCQKISKANKGKVHTQETKQKLSALRVGKKRSEETKEKMRMAWVKRRLK